MNSMLKFRKLFVDLYCLIKLHLSVQLCIQFINLSSERLVRLFQLIIFLLPLIHCLSQLLNCFNFPLATLFGGQSVSFPFFLNLIVESRFLFWLLIEW